MTQSSNKSMSDFLVIDPVYCGEELLSYRFSSLDLNPKSIAYWTKRGSFNNHESFANSRNSSNYCTLTYN